MILVAGATGSVGNRIAHDLLAGGEQVRALVRAASDHAALQAAGAGISIGDVKDPATLDRACRGADVVITTVTMSKRGDDAVANVDLQGNLNLIEAAERAGVSHFVMLSTLGASPESPVELFRAKGLVEQRLRASSMVHTILQPTPFMDVWFGMLVELPLHNGQPVTLVGESRRRHSFIAERDVAAIAAAALYSPAARNVTLPIGGPEAITWLDVVRAYEQAAGRKLEVRSVAPGSPIPGLPEQVWGLAASLETFDSIIPMEATAARLGVKLTSVQEFTRSRLPVVLP